MFVDHRKACKPFPKHNSLFAAYCILNSIIIHLWGFTCINKLASYVVTLL